MGFAEFLHVKPGKGAAFVRTKLKNYITGNVVDKTFRGGENVQQATLEKKETQYTYQDGDDVSTHSLEFLPLDSIVEKAGLNQAQVSRKAPFGVSYDKNTASPGGHNQVAST